jgi:uncharacterized protein (TIGR02147 family)
MIFTYLDYRQFLRDYTQNLKARKAFNLRTFAKAAGIKAPGYLKMIIDGRRNLTQKTADKFALALGLSSRESEYFTVLVQYNQTKNPDEKRDYFDTLISLRPRSQHFVLEKRQNRYFSRHYYVCVREMVALKDFREDYKWMAKRCLPQISPMQAREAVETLLELGLLKRDVDGNLIQVENFIATQDRNTQEVEAYHFHEAVIDKARHALGLLSQNERSYYALTLPLSKSQFEDIITDFYEFRDKVVRKIEQGERDFDDVYQINFQLFPVTKKGDA